MPWISLSPRPQHQAGIEQRSLLRLWQAHLAAEPQQVVVAELKHSWKRSFGSDRPSVLTRRPLAQAECPPGGARACSQRSTAAVYSSCGPAATRPPECPSATRWCMPRSSIQTLTRTCGNSRDVTCGGAHDVRRSARRHRPALVRDGCTASRLSSSEFGGVRWRVAPRRVERRSGFRGWLRSSAGEGGESARHPRRGRSDAGDRGGGVQGQRGSRGHHTTVAASVIAVGVAPVQRAAVRAVPGGDRAGPAGAGTRPRWWHGHVNRRGGPRADHRRGDHSYHLYRGRTKLGVRDRARLVSPAYRSGLI